jgi:hypothetical protein
MRVRARIGAVVLAARRGETLPAQRHVLIEQAWRLSVEHDRSGPGAEIRDG